MKRLSRGVRVILLPGEAVLSRAVGAAPGHPEDVVLVGGHDASDAAGEHLLRFATCWNLRTARGFTRKK